MMYDRRNFHQLFCFPANDVMAQDKDKDSKGLKPGAPFGLTLEHLPCILEPWFESQEGCWEKDLCQSRSTCQVL